MEETTGPENGPQTGRAFCLARLACGASLRRVAAALGVSGETLRHWEMDRAPLAPERAAAWARALAEVARAGARARERELARAGFTMRDLARGHTFMRRIGAA